MPAPRHKPLDDSRSEASSTITNLKEKANQSSTTIAGNSTKGKRNVTNTANDTSSHTKAAAANGNIAVEEEKDPNLPRIDWATFPVYNLHSYRTSYRLSTPSSFTQPHAEILYKSSPIALLAPSQVQARRKLRDLKHQRRKSVTEKSSRNNNGVTKTRGRNAAAMTNDGSLARSIGTSDSGSSSNTDGLGRQDSISLALVVRKHFNAQQMNEGETVAKFTYMVRHSGVLHARGSQVEGSAGDGAGSWMGSQGRQIRKVDGGEAGFRLRFRPT